MYSIRDTNIRESTNGRPDLSQGAHHGVNTVTESSMLFLAHRSQTDAVTRPSSPARRRWANVFRRR